MGVSITGGMAPSGRPPLELGLAVEGIFNTLTVGPTCEALRQCRGADVIRLDFSRASFIEPAALWRLIEALHRSPAPEVLAQGLRAHELRLLHYMGVDPRTLRRKHSAFEP